MFNFKKGKHNKNGALRSIALVLLYHLTVLSVFVFLNKTDFKISAQEAPAQTYNIHSAQEMIDYSRAYATGGRNSRDVLNISINEGSVISDDGFVSIGTSEHPFAGTINIPSAGVDVFHLFDCPLFDYVSTDLTLTGAGTVKIMRERANDEPADGVLTSGALFANNVVAGTRAANWNISLLAYDGEGIESSSFEGLFGTIAADADVTVNFANTSNIAVSGSGNTGLICGTLNAGAKLSVAMSGSGNDLTVTSSNGNAGGLVGEMKSGSTLKFCSPNNSRVTRVTSTNNYAGGIVGQADSVVIEYADGVTDYTVSGNVTGKAGAGGLFGRYIDTDPAAEFGLEDTYAITAGMSISSTNYAGGIFGVLENNSGSFTFDGNSASEGITVNLSGGKYRGGICGLYKSNALSNTLEITDTATTVTASTASSSTVTNYTGGLIGTLLTTPSYVKIHDVSCTSGSSPNAGLIGSTGSGGSFVDLTGNISVSGTYDAGLIADMPQGVMRMSGEFDLTGYVQYSASSGYLVKERNRALIYALGDGSGTVGNWTFKRNTYRTVDDIHGWGQVIRMDGTKLAESNLLTVDMTAHTVTVAPAVTSMASLTDFAKTALNIKLNTGAGVGALKFTSGNANLSSTLLSGNLSISTDIALTGTGLNGFTRDDGNNAAFSGTFEGNNHTVTFAIGENYGTKENGTALDASSKQGNVFQHGFNGLFAKTNNATVQNLTLSGEVKIHQSAKDLRFGGVSAYATGGLTLDNITTDYTVKTNLITDVNAFYGGVVGIAAGSGLDVQIENSTIGLNITDISNTGGSNSVFVGGAIGLMNAENGSTFPTAVEYTSNQSVTFDSTALSLNYNKTGTSVRPSVFGSAIAGSTNCIYGKDNRKIEFNDVSVDIDVTGAKSVNRKLGAILGTDWYATDVTIDNMTVNGSIAATGDAGDFGGLVRTATGRWKVNSISLESADFSLPSASGSTFGFVANKSTVSGTGNAKSALFLEINNKDSNYDISALNFVGNSPTFTVYDEIVADSSFDTDIVANGNSIISIATSDNILKTDGSAYNTYLNKTAYGQTAANKINPNTRYYYNVDYARANTATPKYDFLVWSVKTYAHSSLADWFECSDSFTGDLDMTGLSYYPVDLNGSVTFRNAVLTLDNALMEDNVKYAYSGVTGRTTRENTNQHYLMHTAAFRNDSGSNISITGSSGLTLRGNVPKLSDNFCGFLVAGMLGNSDTKNVRFNASKITLDGAHITTSTGADITNTAYAPLVINKVGKNTSVTISGAEQSSTAYSSYASAGKYAGSSLIGDVGSTTARAIYLTFAGLKLDGRSSASAITSMNTAYGTGKSVFSRATILNSFLYSGESSGSYTFEITDDWGNSGNAIHKVTYGKEITTSVEFADKQKKYYGSTYYTHPTAYQSASEYDFSTGFLPYVYTAYNLSEYKHELAVNVTFESEISGCGKYNDPFIIDDDEKLPIISRIINGQNVGNSVKLYLPNDLTSFNYTKTNYTKYSYNFGTDNFTSSNGGSSISNANARRYLAGAYYVITKDIELPNDYVALGTTDNNSNVQYAFRGVIIGRNVTVTNHSRSPLIHTSLGSVVKDITVKVDVDYNSSNVIELSAPLGNATYNYVGGIQSYGAVIGQILGGDNIIDNTDVDFDNVSFSITSASSSYYPRLTPVGGYVGTHFGGSLIFRNMTSSNVGLTAAKFDKISDEGYLYVNPIIGRVVNGYAFHELQSGSYNVVSTALNNGTKNYTIPDLSLASGKITVTDASSTYTITVPDGQAMYILGAIVNSGGACAETGGNITNNIKAYNTLSDLWQAYRSQTTVRGGAYYTGVGSSSGEDFTAAQLDSYTTSAAKIPYIARAYTSNDNSCLYIRSLTRRTNNVVNITGECNVPSGFRGIGHLYLNNDYTRLTVRSVSGATNSTPASNTVTLHMDYRQYEKNNVTAYQSVANTAGFGLFNVLKMNGASETNSVKNIVLSGSVFYDIYKIDGTKSDYKCGTYASSSNTSNVTSGQVNADEYLSAGGLAGLINSAKYYIKDVTFNNLSVEGAKSAGGLIGYVSLQNVTDISYIKYSDGTVNPGYVNVVGGLSAGGLIGRVYMAKTEIMGDSANGTDVIIKTIELKSTSLDGKGTRGYIDNQIIGAGGLIGSLWSLDKESGGSKDTTRTGITNATNSKRTGIDHMNVVKGTENALIRVKNDTSSVENLNMAGGFVGLCHNSMLYLSNCKLTNVDIRANVAGGIVGMFTQKYFPHFSNVVVDGGGSHTITGRQYAGGVVGRLNGHDERCCDINDTTVKNYTIQSDSTTSASGCAAGGIVGGAIGDNRTESSFIDVEIRNSTVKDCTIKTNYTYNSSTTGCGTGGVIGVSTAKGSYKMKFTGYNLLIEGVTLIHLDGGTTDKSTAATNHSIGDFIGNNVGTSPLKFVGVTTNNESYCGKHAGSHNSSSEAYGGGYIVFADFDATDSNTSFAGIDDTSTEADDYTDVAAASPYVTANPSLTFGGIKLTGDGTGTSVETLPIRSIMADTASGRYAYAAAARYVGNTGDTNFAAVNANLGKFAMFRSEASEYIGADFPVLVLDDTVRENSHKMINSYIRMLTNTRYDYGTDSSGIYDVKIYNMAYDDHFSPKSTGASLKRDGGQFYMLNSQFDSGKIQFSLIDIRFIDPQTSSDEVAYHLYVPVFVKKVLSYRFDIAELSGTTYLENLYTPRFGQALIENTGTPITLYFRYTYSRTAAEWEQAINAGEDVNRNYEKSLLFYKANTNELLKQFPDDTVFTLVDNNNNNKPYYATLSDAFSTNTLNLSAFKETITTDINGEYEISGNNFAPQTLQSLMTMSVTQDNANGTLVTCGVSDASVIVSGQGYRGATEEELASGSIAKYTVSVSDVKTEDYYLSIYTESNAVNDELFHYYLITSPSSFSDPAHPSKITDTGAHTMVHLVMGKIFYHSNLSISSNSSTGSPMMTAANNLLVVDMTAQFGLSDDLDSDIRPDVQNLIAATNVYQSFIVYLNRKENLHIRKAILGNPDAAGSYSVDYVLNGTADTASSAYSAGTINLSQNCAEFVTGDLSSFFASGNRFEIDSSITLTYSADAIPTQFPGRADVPPTDSNGVTVSGASNIAFQQYATTYSKNTIDAAEYPQRAYYSEIPPEVATLDLNPIGDRVGDFTPLGINALNNKDATVADFDLVADLNIGSIADRITDYTDAQVTVQLSKKQSDGTYSLPLDISQYMTIDFDGLTGVSSDSVSYYRAINRANLTENAAMIELPIIHCHVITGSELERLGFTYGNYKITVTVVLRVGSNKISVSQASNFVVYTNAKVIPEFVQ